MAKAETIAPTRRIFSTSPGTPTASSLWMFPANEMLLAPAPATTAAVPKDSPVATAPQRRMGELLSFAVPNTSDEAMAPASRTFARSLVAACRSG